MPCSGFGQPEVTQQHTIDGQNHPAFSCSPEHLASGPRDGERAGVWIARGAFVGQVPDPVPWAEVLVE